MRFCLLLALCVIATVAQPISVDQLVSDTLASSGIHELQLAKCEMKQGHFDCIAVKEGSVSDITEGEKKIALLLPLKNEDIEMSDASLDEDGFYKHGHFWKKVGHAVKEVGKVVGPVVKDAATGEIRDAAGRVIGNVLGNTKHINGVEMEEVEVFDDEGMYKGKFWKKIRHGLGHAVKEVGKVVGPVVKDAATGAIHDATGRVIGNILG